MFLQKKSTTRSNRVESQRTSNKPGTHSATVLVNNQTVRCITVKFGTDPPHQLLGAPRPPTVEIHISHVGAGLIAMGIRADEATDVRLRPAGGSSGVVEKGVQKSC
ncbi:MAG: hypothetical protein NZM65_07090 [Flavobacteriales bacterium]|nr:hypothetical protein [Flavobacteriales bacterium]MDW8410438.1 hypothetical protein [Flavobacteriales bacterium]